jgi:hypothetical protein
LLDGRDDIGLLFRVRGLQGVHDLQDPCERVDTQIENGATGEVEFEEAVEFVVLVGLAAFVREVDVERAVR